MRSSETEISVMKELLHRRRTICAVQRSSWRKSRPGVRFDAPDIASLHSVSLRQSIHPWPQSNFAVTVSVLLKSNQTPMNGNAAAGPSRLSRPQASLDIPPPQVCPGCHRDWPIAEYYLLPDGSRDVSPASLLSRAVIILHKSLTHRSLLAALSRPWLTTDRTHTLYQVHRSRARAGIMVGHATGNGELVIRS